MVLSLVVSRGRALFTSGWRHHFRLSRDVDRSHRAIAPSIARSIAGPCCPSLTCLLFQHGESFSWPLPKPARLCKVSAFRRVGIQAIKSLQKKKWKGAMEEKRGTLEATAESTAVSVGRSGKIRQKRAVSETKSEDRCH